MRVGGVLDVDILHSSRPDLKMTRDPEGKGNTSVQRIKEGI
jgi:hypothetical protein